MRSWRTYEDVAKELLSRNAERFGLQRVEGKQKIVGCKPGTEYEIDAKGLREGDIGFVIIECRHYLKSRQNREKLGALAYRIQDAGAEGGIIVSLLPHQRGAKSIAGADEGIVEVQLNADRSPDEFVMKFLSQVMTGLRSGMSCGDSAMIGVKHSHD